MSSKTQRITGWILTCLLGLFLIGPSAAGKFVDWPGKNEMFDHMGLTPNLVQTIGIIEIAITIVFLIPRTSFVGAILVTAYLGGAVMTHVRVGDAWFFPIIIGVVMWIALGLKHPEIFSLAFGKSTRKSDSEGIST